MDRSQILRSRLAENVRKRREASGLSQEALADRCGLHRTYVGSIERNERNLTIGTVLKIADALGCDILEIVPRSKDL